MKPKYVIIKELNALEFHNYIYGLIQYYNHPKVDVIITSPPYNIGMPYAGYKDDMDNNMWLDTIIHSLYPTDKICNDGALMFLNMKTDLDRPLISTEEIFFIGREIEELSDWKFIQEIIWVMPNKQQLNPFKVVDRFSSYTEKILLFGKGRDVKVRKDLIGEELSEEYLRDKRYRHTIEKYKKKFGRAFRDIGDVWVIPTLKYNQHLKRLNPAEFPPQLPEMCIKSHPEFEKRQLTIYDPFGGGGTTALVAYHLNCHIYSCDISKAAIDTSKRRVNKKYKNWRKGK